MEAQMSNFVALVVEDDAVQREFVAELLKDGLEVVECSTAEAAEFWCPRERNFWPW
jgi:CheY-like chemotaxis protein